LTALPQTRTTIGVSTSDARTLDELRREAAELRASRARVVTAADDQRRSIERELHDGAMQHLVALGVNLQLASGLADGHAPELTEILDGMLRTVHEALDEVRRLASRVYPSLLLARGLGDALRTAAAEAATPTRVEVAAIGRCSPETEASIYFCCLELLQNAADGGHDAAVRIRREGSSALFDVTLEGADFEQWTTRDLSGLHDRLGAFGGRLAIEHVPGGVRIVGTLPMLPGNQALFA
jgi:signal transduction histidine kinase